MRLSAWVLGLLLLSACGGATETPPPLPPETSGQEQPEGSPDAGVSPPDSGVPDAGGPRPDAGTPRPDAGTSGPDAGTPVAPAWPELQTSIPTYVLSISPEDQEALDEHIKDRDFMVPARFTFEGRTWNVEVRYRGRSTRFEEKKPWQVRFDKEDRFLGGAKRLELLAEYDDGGYLMEKLWYDLAASVGMKVPSVRYVHLMVNGQYQGVYTEVESIDKPFLKAHGLDGDSDIYRCGMHDCELRPPPAEAYMEAWDKRTNEDQPWDRLWSFIDDISRTPPHQFRAFAEEHVALDEYLTWMVIDAFISNEYQTDSRSYLVFDPKREKWVYVPWDLNNALSLYDRNGSVEAGVTWRAERPPLCFTAYDPLVYELAEFRRNLGYADMKPAWNTLSTRIVDDEVLRARFVSRMRQLLDTWLTEENLNARINAMHRLLAPFILAGPEGKAKDPWVSPPHAAYSPEFLRRFVHERRAWLRAHLSDISAHGQGPLVIDRVGRDASGAWWVQLYNRGNTAAPLDGLYLTGFTRLPTQSRLAAATVPPRGFVTLRQGAADASLRLGAVLSPERPEVALFAADGRTALDMMWLAPLAPGQAYGRQPRGAETFGPQSGP
ncbi:CotH kinase family protein [Hyalangium gracile]|uniref:CotH kinase family protein n=1 Tax=Hyalangium gracile TaxID=394092 RepID=UPI001CCA19E5|nr:CotH kinase family protein [Hyalangium gracile]